MGRSAARVTFGRRCGRGDQKRTAAPVGNIRSRKNAIPAPGARAPDATLPRVLLGNQVNGLASAVDSVGDQAAIKGGELPLMGIGEGQ